MGVENIITFEAHDPRVQNAIPLHGFETVTPAYQLVKGLLNNTPGLQIDSDHMLVISPDAVSYTHLMNTQYDSIMRMYAARQARSRQEYEERMEQIQKDVPELAPLDADITACQAALVRSAVEENPARRADLKSRLKNLQEQRNALLSAHGLTPASLEPMCIRDRCGLQARNIQELSCTLFLENIRRYRQHE